MGTPRIANSALLEAHMACKALLPSQVAHQGALLCATNVADYTATADAQSSEIR
jgi:hypothetical protein